MPLTQQGSHCRIRCGFRLHHPQRIARHPGTSEMHFSPPGRMQPAQEAEDGAGAGTGWGIIRSGIQIHSRDGENGEFPGLY
jgi:hypothetical protein